jgi:competence protein ComEA
MKSLKNIFLILLVLCSFLAGSVSMRFASAGSPVSVNGSVVTVDCDQVKPAPAPAAPGIDSKPDIEGSKDRPIKPAAGAININTGTLAELDELPGVGPVLAQRIIDNRPYYAAEDLLAVPGIGQAKLSKMTPFITW